MTDNTREIEEIKEAITDFINPYPRACFRQLNLNKLCSFLAELTPSHQELQEARQEAVTKFASDLRTIIERGNAETAMNIIRRQSELDQPTSDK